MIAVTISFLLLAVGSASAQSARGHGPWPLVSLAALGTVTWRCDPAASPSIRPGVPALALGFHVARLGQTGHLTLTVQHRTVRSTTVQPGQTVTLPFLRAPVQRLDISEGGEDGTLRAIVTVSFPRPSVSSYCWPYMPPKIQVLLAPRQ